MTNGELPHNIWSLAETQNIWLSPEVDPVHLTHKDGTWDAILIMGNTKGYKNAKPMLYTEYDDGSSNLINTDPFCSPIKIYNDNHFSLKTHGARGSTFNFKRMEPESYLAYSERMPLLMD